MSYPCEWRGSTDADDVSGIACFMVEGKEYSFRLECFEDLGRISNMLDEAFVQGKQFAASMLRNEALHAMDKCIRDRMN